VGEIKMYDHRGGSLLGLLEDIICLYEQDRENHWSKIIQYDQAERFAKSVLKISEQLIAIEPIDDDLGVLQYETNDPQFFTPVFAADSPLDKESPLKLVWERFSIDLANESVEKITKGAKRIFDLYKLVLDTHPSKPTQQFLARISRCYIWGFEPECVILCRAVLDTAFKDAVTFEVYDNYVKKNNKNSGALENRINAAYETGIINREISDKAHTVRIRGNKAVHEQPDATKDAWGTVRNTLAVLEALHKGKFT
jgi:hypothetical protein